MCFTKGGGLADKTKCDEYLASRRHGHQGAARETAATVFSLSLSAPSAIDPSSGRPFVVDPKSGKAYFLSIDPPAGSTLVAQPDLDSDNFVSLATDATPAWLDSVATPADMLEYTAMVSFTSEENVSLNWIAHAHDTADPSAYSAAPLPAVSHCVSTAGSEPFVFDSGASTHLSPNKADFYELWAIAPCGIRGVNGSVIYAYGISKVRLHVGRGASLVLNDVLYVPLATVRLISISALCSSASRYIVHFNNNGVHITTPGGALIATSKLTAQRLYSLSSTPPSTEHVFLSAHSPTLDTWHRRLGHINHCTIYNMAHLHSAKGMPITLSPAPSKCEHCILSKQTRTAVPKVREGERAMRKLGLVYTDLQGQMDTWSANGNLYSLDIIDDFSSMLWSIPILLKDAAEPCFEAWVNAVEAELDEKIGAIQIDNGELLSKDFKAFLEH